MTPCTLYTPQPPLPSLEFFEAVSHAYDELIRGECTPVDKATELKGRFHLHAAEQMNNQPLDQDNIRRPVKTSLGLRGMSEQTAKQQ